MADSIFRSQVTGRIKIKKHSKFPKIPKRVINFFMQQTSAKNVALYNFNEIFLGVGYILNGLKCNFQTCHVTGCLIAMLVLIYI